MKKLFLFIALAMFSLSIDARETEVSSPVVNCLKKAMYITDLQSARSDLQKKAKQCEDDAAAALDIYKRVMDIDMKIAQLSFELRKDLYSVPEEDKNCNEMEFVMQIVNEMEK